MYVGIGLCFFSMCCNWVAAGVFRTRAFKIANELRYDLYICYFTKCLKVNFDKNTIEDMKNGKEMLNIKTPENLKQFDMNRINEDIETMLVNFQICRPRQIKRAVMSAFCPLAMFYICWQFSVVCFGGMILLVFFNLMSTRILQKRFYRSHDYKDKLS